MDFGLGGNPVLRNDRWEMTLCFFQCFDEDSYMQFENGKGDVDPRPHYHIQTLPGPNGLGGVYPGVYSGNRPAGPQE